MTRAQQIHYRAALWPAACAAQGWDHLSAEEQEAKRRAITREASGGRTESTREIDSKWQCTRLFQILKQLAEPIDLDAARAVANPTESEREDGRRRLIYSITQLGFHERYIARVAEGYCRAERVGQWQRLNEENLAHIRVTLTARRQAQRKNLPQVRGAVAIAENQYEYTMRRAA